MANNDKYKEIFISRLMPCKECQEKGYPKKGQLFLTYGSKTHKYKIHKIPSDPPAKKAGITPHFVQALGLNKTDDAVVIIRNCCIDGCGINLIWNEKQGMYDIHFKNVNVTVLPIPEWDALFFRWHNGTGFELD